MSAVGIAAMAGSAQPDFRFPTGGAPIVLVTLHVPHPLTNWPPPNWKIPID